MLKLIIEAQLPLVAVHTRDVLNLPEVLKHLTGKTPIRWTTNQKMLPNQIYFFIQGPKPVELPLIELYNHFVAAESTLLIVNPKEVKEPMFNAGEVPVPRTMLLNWLAHVVEDKKAAEDLLRGLGGVTIKEAAELARLTMARDNSLTVNGLMETRRSAFLGSNGLTPVDCSQPFYEPPEALQEWIKKEKNYFLNGKDPRLMPRGLLFAGPAGTGKSSGAKWIASQIGVPLYRMDIGGTKSKYVGESEGRMLQNLSRIDNEAPAVCLFDEVEKVFSTNANDTSGTTASMLSQLLWWLAERRSRILVIMTTNNEKVLPKELYREGRIDEIVMMDGLDLAQSLSFLEHLLATFKMSLHTNSLKILLKSTPTVGSQSDGSPIWAQAALTKSVYSHVKDSLSKKEFAS